MKVVILILAVIVLWYTFGRKPQFINHCINRDGNEKWKSMSEAEKRSDCERMYSGFKDSSVNWMPFAFY